MAEDMYDLDLVVEGKKVKAMSAVLAYNSTVFKTLLTNARTTQLMGYNDMEQQDKMDQRLRLEIPNAKYRDMKTLVTSLQIIGDAKPITGDTALRILPLAVQYQIKQLIKVSEKSLLFSLKSMQEKHGRGNIDVHDVMKYLSAADTYKLDKLRLECIDELSFNSNSSRRRQIVQENHVTEKTKLKILDKLCTKLEDDHAANLREIRNDMDKRCREIEKRRDEFMDYLETWKSDLRHEIDDVLDNAKRSHEKLTEELHQKNLIANLESQLKQTTDELLIEQQHINDRMQSLIETMKGNEIIGDTEATKMREDLEEAQGNIVNNIENIATRFRSRVESNLRVCTGDKTKEYFSSSYLLEENVRQSIEEITEKMKQTETTKIALEEEKLAHENTKTILTKLRMKEHEINTWLKWAKPETSDEDKCMCFRHSKGKRSEY
ncbi:hypothetical protein ACF0H5_008834 [Mactra antiquata]